MDIRHTQSFKIQAVEKALSRSPQTSLQEIADSHGISYSTLGTWMRKSMFRFNALPKCWISVIPPVFAMSRVKPAFVIRWVETVR